jgi:hypothetical protein
MRVGRSIFPEGYISDAFAVRLGAETDVAADIIAVGDPWHTLPVKPVLAAQSAGVGPAFVEVIDVELHRGGRQPKFQH